MTKGRQWVALFLSGIFPGLGQFYVRAWGKGLLFLIVGAVATWTLGALISLDDLLAGAVSHPLGLLGALLALLAVFLWSAIDAWISAR